MISGPSSALVEPDLEFEDLPLRQARRRPDFVVRLGPKAFELSAGFLRIRDGDDPLDASGVHPEAYPVVRRILAATKSQLDSLIRNTPVLRQLEPEAFTDTVFGVPTVTAILRELEKPGRDPRPAYKTANSCEGVEKLEDLKPGMVLEGVVTNVAGHFLRRIRGMAAEKCHWMPLRWRERHGPLSDDASLAVFAATKMVASFRRLVRPALLMQRQERCPKPPHTAD